MPRLDSYELEKETGLRKIEELDEKGLSYEFNSLGVFLHVPTGRIYWATTSGCSCPSPYEEYRFDSPDNHDLREIEKGHKLEEFQEAVDNFPADPDEKMKILGVVSAALRNASKDLT